MCVSAACCLVEDTEHRNVITEDFRGWHWYINSSGETLLLVKLPNLCVYIQQKYATLKDIKFTILSIQYSSNKYCNPTITAIHLQNFFLPKLYTLNNNSLFPLPSRGLYIWKTVMIQFSNLHSTFCLQKYDYAKHNTSHKRTHTTYFLLCLACVTQHVVFKVLSCSMYQNSSSFKAE